MARLESPIVMLITDGSATESNFDDARRRIVSLARAAAENEISFIQIREKLLPPTLLAELSFEVVEVTRGRTRVLINEFTGIALATGADGAQLPSPAPTLEDVRKSWSSLIFGVSAHSLADVESARDRGADFALFSPVFASPGKGPPVGIEELRRVKAAVGDFPVIALGGVDATNWRECLEVADGFAAIRFLNDASGLAAVGREVSRRKNRTSTNERG